MGGLAGAVIPTKRSAVFVPCATWGRLGQSYSGISRNLLVAWRHVVGLSLIQWNGRLNFSDAWCDSIQVYPTDRTRAVGSREQKLKHLTEAQLFEDWQFPDGLKATNTHRFQRELIDGSRCQKLCQGVSSDHRHHIIHGSSSHWKTTDPERVGVHRNGGGCCPMLLFARACGR